MSAAKDDEQFLTFLNLATTLYKANEADALLVMLQRPVDWKALKKKTSRLNILLVATDEAILKGAKEGIGSCRASTARNILEPGH